MDPNHHHSQQHHQPPTTHPPQHAQQSQPGYVPQQPAHNFQYTMQLPHHTQSFPRAPFSPASYVSNVPYYHGYVQPPYNWQATAATFTRASAPVTATTTTTPKAKPVREIRRLRIVNPKTNEEVDLGASQKSTSDKDADDSHEDITIKKDDAEGEVKLHEEKTQSDPTNVDKNDHHEDVNDRDENAKLEDDRADIKVKSEQEEGHSGPIIAEEINQQSNSSNDEATEQQPNPIKAEVETNQRTDPNIDEKAEQPSEPTSDGGTDKQDGVDNTDEHSAETENQADGKEELHYEEGQFNPISNRSGRKKYSRSFMLEVCEKICKLDIDTEVSPESNMPSYNLDRTDNFLPAYQQHVKYQSANSNRQNPNNYTGRSSAGQERQRKVIVPSSSLTNEVELKTVSNPWRPGNKVKEEVSDEILEVETLKKKFRSILNKLTPQNFDSLANAVTELHIDTEAKLGEVIDIVFAKALAEPGYCVLYGQMCSHLKKISAGTANFGNTLLKRCQNQFQADIYQGLEIDERRKKIDEEEDPEKKKQLDEELYEDMFRCRMRGLGLIKFIGELYKIEMLIDKIMFDCIQRLLIDPSSEESIECLCDLLKTIGEKLDRSSQASARENQKSQKSQSKPFNYRSALAPAPKAPEPVTMTLDPIFEQLHKIRKNKDLPLSIRIRFKLLDLCELREKDNWQSKGKDNNPKKLDEIKKDHLESERQKSMGPRKSQEGRRGLGQGGGSSSQLSSLGNESGPNRNSFHSSASSQSIRDHEHGERTLRDNSDNHKQSEQHRVFTTNVLEKFKSAGASLDTTSSTAGSLRPTTFLRGSTKPESLRPSYRANHGPSAAKNSEQDVPK